MKVEISGFSLEQMAHGTRANVAARSSRAVFYRKSKSKGNQPSRACLGSPKNEWTLESLSWNGFQPIRQMNRLTSAHDVSARRWNAYAEHLRGAVEVATARILREASRPDKSFRHRLTEN
jgi:hypothetical protein